MKRSDLTTLACVNAEYQLFRRVGANNLVIRGEDEALVGQLVYHWGLVAHRHAAWYLRPHGLLFHAANASVMTDASVASLTSTGCGMTRSSNKNVTRSPSLL